MLRSSFEEISQEVECEIPLATLEFTPAGVYLVKREQSAASSRLPTSRQETVGPTAATSSNSNPPTLIAEKTNQDASSEEMDLEKKSEPLRKRRRRR